MSTKLEGDLVHGDVIVLHEDVVIAFFKGLSVSNSTKSMIQCDVVPSLRENDIAAPRSTKGFTGRPSVGNGQGNS